MIKKNLALLLVLIAGLVSAQEGHYWTQQYGTRSMLLSGSVIGGVSDLGAVYYNPGRLSQIENPAFLISADVYEMNQITINDAFGENLDTKKRDIRGIPSLAAGTFNVPFLPKHHFAWAILVRTNSNIGFGYSNEVYDDVIEYFPGEEYFSGKLSLDRQALDQWTGLNWSYPLTEKLSIGASGFFTYYTQSKSTEINLKAYTSTNETAVYNFSKSISMENYSLIGKIGLSYTADFAIIGFTVLTPRLNLKGSGNYSYERIHSGTDFSPTDDLYSTNSQSGLSSTFKSPWAIGAGISLPFKKSFIHLSGEWYSKVPQYTLLKTAEHKSQSNDTIISLELIDEMSSVVNFGLGLEIYLNEKLSWYLSSSTDFSAVNSGITSFASNKPIANNSTFNANFYHFGGGVVLHVKGADVTLGATYTGASQYFSRPVNFPSDSADEIFDENDQAKMEWDRVRVVFSFSMPFLKDVQKKVEERLGF